MECAEANKALSRAILEAVMYAEKVESTSRVLALADCSVGRIRSRMRAYGIPIQCPSSIPNAALLSDVNGYGF